MLKWGWSEVLGSSPISHRSGFKWKFCSIFFLPFPFSTTQSVSWGRKLCDIALTPHHILIGPSPPFTWSTSLFFPDIDTLFNSLAQSSKSPYLNGGAFHPLVPNHPVTKPTLLQNRIWIQQPDSAVKDTEAYPDGTDFSIGHILLAPLLIILTAWAKFKWSIKCTH